MSKLDAMIENAIEKQIAARAPGIIERVVGRLLDEHPVTAPAPAPKPTAKPAKRRAQTAKAKPAAKAQRGGPMPGSVADQVLQAIAKEPHTEAELGELLAKIDATDEAKRQAVARLAKSGRLVVSTERNTRVYRLAAASADPS